MCNVVVQGGWVSKLLVQAHCSSCGSGIGVSDTVLACVQGPDGCNIGAGHWCATQIRPCFHKGDGQDAHFSANLQF